jgi:hypothetical protein
MYYIERKVSHFYTKARGCVEKKLGEKLKDCVERDLFKC